MPQHAWELCTSAEGWHARPEAATGGGSCLSARRSEKQAVNSFFDANGPGSLRWYYQV